MKILLKTNLYLKSALALGIFVSLALSGSSCSMPNEQIASSTLNTSSFEVRCSANEPWYLTRDTKDYTIGSLLSSSQGEYRFSLLPLSGQLENWETWHAIVVKQVRIGHTQYVTQIDPIDGSERILGLATNELGETHLEKERQNGIHYNLIRTRFDGFINEQVYIDSKISTNHDEVEAIFNLYIEEINYVRYNQLNQHSKVFEILGQFEKDLASKMLEVAQEHDIYIVGIERNDFLWNIEHKKWMIDVSSNNVIVGREALIDYLKESVQDYSYLLYRATQKNDDGFYKDLDQQFFFYLLNSYRSR